MCESDREGRGGDARSAGTWVVRGIPYRNSAAAFWRRLLDDLAVRFSACNRAMLTTTSGGRIHPGLLTPEIDLAAALESDRDAGDLAEGIRELVAGLELTGPAPVELTVLHDDDALGRAPDLIEAVDSEVFLYLVAWLLRWSEVPPRNWNRKVVEGGFSALASDIRRVYDCGFNLENRHLSEGLRERTLVLAFGTYRAV